MRPITITIAGLTLAAGLTACAAPTASRPLTHASPTTSSTPVPVAETPAFHTPTADDFTLKLKTLTKECFDSAGCLVTYRVTLGYDKSAGELDPNVTYDLTYTVKGGEEPVIDTIDVTGDQYGQPDEQMIDTKSSKSKLVPVITEVSEQ